MYLGIILDRKKGRDCFTLERRIPLRLQGWKIELKIAASTLHHNLKELASTLPLIPDIKYW